MIEMNMREKSALAQRLRDYCAEELGCEIGQLQAELFAGFLEREFAPIYYNSGLRDAQTHLMKRFEEVADSIVVLEARLPG